jgi:hypothetical protein
VKDIHKLFYVLFLSGLLLQQVGKATFIPLTVQEFDGSPSVTKVKNITFNGATLSDLLNGNVLVNSMPKKMDTVLLVPSTGNFPNVNFAVVDLGSKMHRLLFDASTDESIYWSNIKISNYQSGLLTARIGYSMASATSNRVVFNIDTWCVSPGDAADIDVESYDAVNASSAITVPGTAGYFSEINIPLTNKDSLADGDLCAFRLTRDADNPSDDASGDAEVRYVKISE